VLSAIFAAYALSGPVIWLLRLRRIRSRGRNPTA
jgi:hypothetical protein